MDLDLRNLGYYTGTEKYYYDPLFGKTNNYTEGVKYVKDNGYSWFISDVLANVIPLKKKEEFISIELKVLDSKATVIITDGNDNKLIENLEYSYTNVKKNLKLFFLNNTLCLPSEN